jgi:diacylglycerol kinase family enzyme
MRRRRAKGKHSHYCLLVNRAASGYDARHIKKLIEGIRGSGGYYTVFEPESAALLHQTAQRVCGLRPWRRGAPQHFARRGKVSALIACGGDGTFNIVAKVALKADIPAGMLPMGDNNDIARSLCGVADIDVAIEKILKRSYRKIDTVSVGQHFVVGSAGIGLIPEISRMLKKSGRPRFCLGWSSLAAKATASVKTKKMTVKIDAFRFEVHPVMLNINLLPYSVTLPFSPASVVDDRCVEVILSFEPDAAPLSTFVRQVCRKKHMYGDHVRLYRGTDINIEPLKNVTLFCDGELVELKETSLKVTLGERQLKVFC